MDAFDRDEERVRYVVCRACQRPARENCGRVRDAIWRPSPRAKNPVRLCDECERKGKRGKARARTESEWHESARCVVAIGFVIAAHQGDMAMPSRSHKGGAAVISDHVLSQDHEICASTCRDVRFDRAMPSFLTAWRCITTGPCHVSSPRIAAAMRRERPRSQRERFTGL